MPILAPAKEVPGSPILLESKSCFAAGDGSRQPTDQEFEGARYQGRRVAETAAKLVG